MAKRVESVKLVTTPFILSAVAHVLAWAATLWLVFSPSLYQGVTLTTDGGSAQTSASLIEINGLWVLIPLLVPIMLTAVAFFATLLPNLSRKRLIVALWALALLLLALCALGIFSIGLFYLPTAIALLVAAALASLRRPSAAQAGAS